MGLADIKARLSHIAGIENLTVETDHAREIYHLGEQTVEIPTNNAGVRNRVQFLSDGLKNSPEALAKVDQAVAIIQQPKPNTETKRMSVSGLTHGILQTKLAELRQRGQDRLAAGVAKIDAAHNQGLAKVDAAMDDISKKIDKEIDDTIQEFAESTNGGPA